MPFCRCCCTCESEENLMVYHIGSFETLVYHLNNSDVFSVDEILHCLDILGVDTNKVDIYCKKCYFTFFQELSID